MREREQDAEDDEDGDGVGPVQEEDQVVGDDVIAGEDLALDEVEAVKESGRHLEIPLSYTSNKMFLLIAANTVKLDQLGLTD